MNLKVCILIFVIYTQTILSSNNTERINEYCGFYAPDKCYLCFNSYIDGGNCVLPSTKIENCIRYSNSIKCLICKNGYRLIDGKCVALTLKKCLKSTDNISCLFCDGYHNDKNDNICSGIPCFTEGCSTCKIKSENEVCVSCDSGYLYNSSLFSCEKMEGKNEGCATLFYGKCVQCIYGYYVKFGSSFNSVICAKSTKYGSIRVIGIGIFYIFNILFNWN